MQARDRESDDGSGTSLGREEEQLRPRSRQRVAATAECEALRQRVAQLEAANHALTAQLESQQHALHAAQEEAHWARQALEHAQAALNGGMAVGVPTTHPAEAPHGLRVVTGREYATGYNGEINNGAPLPFTPFAPVHSPTVMESLWSPNVHSEHSYRSAFSPLIEAQPHPPNNGATQEQPQGYTSPAVIDFRTHTNHLNSWTP